MLRSRLLSARYVAILAQCMVVVGFSLTAILAGPIARYSTRRATVIRDMDVPGLLPSRYVNGIDYANVEWNLTYSRLDKAGFPLDQLLDYLPDNAVDWSFDATQWNSSWSLECQSTPKTVISLETTGQCESIWYEMPGLMQVVDSDRYDAAYTRIYRFNSDTQNVKDSLNFIVGFNNLDHVEAENTFRKMDLVIASIHLHGAAGNDNITMDCDFGIGPIEHSSFTKVECTIQRRESVNDYNNIAFPDIDYDFQSSLPNALISYYAARMTQESTSDQSIATIQPDELVRFYQTYTITKDIQYRQPVTRSLNVKLSVVQISVVFLTFAAFIALLIILGLINYALFALRHRRTMRMVPQSKLDWVIQSIQPEEHPLVQSGSQSRLRTTLSPTHGIISGDGGLKRRTAEFEAATYGQPQSNAWVNKDSMAASQHPMSPAVSHILSPQFPQNKTPLLEQRDVLDDESRRSA